MTDETTPPPPASQTGTAVRDIALIVGALPALLAVLGTRDLTKVVDYIASVQFAPALGVILTGGVMLWRQRHAARVKNAAPATIVTGPAIVTPLDETAPEPERDTPIKQG
jgi:hypothetical protein